MIRMKNHHLDEKSSFRWKIISVSKLIILIRIHNYDENVNFNETLSWRKKLSLIVIKIRQCFSLRWKYEFRMKNLSLFFIMFIRTDKLIHATSIKKFTSPAGKSPTSAKKSKKNPPLFPVSSVLRCYFTHVPSIYIDWSYTH